MARILLVHGSAHGAWCWHDLIPELARLGHKAVAIDLPGHGDRPAPMADITLDAYARAILDALDGPTLVVGHSMAGYPISRAAELDPTHFTRLVYLAAWVPEPGKSLADLRAAAPYQPLAKVMRQAADGLSVTFGPDDARAVFYHDCSEEQVAYALPRLCPQAIAPQVTPFETDGRWDAVPKSYILCEDDRAVPPESQRLMAARMPAGQRHSLPTGHSPFFAAPRALAALIDGMA